MLGYKLSLEEWNLPYVQGLKFLKKNSHFIAIKAEKPLENSTAPHPSPCWFPRTVHWV